ncbi:hypothetical protein F5Y16DRAFT_418836 [Xylariaceae sp. FL0255]|nr:hypothetical protein F5Y16DRAFT_418836 [Xylariaceae sp. FL0255]
MDNSAPVNNALALKVDDLKTKMDAQDTQIGETIKAFEQIFEAMTEQHAHLQEADINQEVAIRTLSQRTKDMAEQIEKLNEKVAALRAELDVAKDTAKSLSKDLNHLGTLILIVLPIVAVAYFFLHKNNEEFIDMMKDSVAMKDAVIKTKDAAIAAFEGFLARASKLSTSENL